MKKINFLFYSYVFLLLIILCQFWMLSRTAIELHNLKNNVAFFVATVYKINAEMPVVNKTIKTNTLQLEQFLRFEKIILEGKSIMDKYDFIKTNEEYK
jgi:hypothetical protein